MNRAGNKSARLIQIENLLLAHPEGLPQAEIARKLQVDRSTINRDLVDLPKHIYIEDDGRLRIDRSADLINVRLNLHEALAVHLASRLLATRMDRQNRHAAAALRKLGLAMERWAKRISAHVLQSADVMDDAARRDDPVYLDVLEKLTEAWANERKIHIWHQGEAGEKVLEYLLCPYFIEPYAVGQTTHVIGLAQMLRDGGGLTAGKMRTFKIERIRRAEVTRDPYEIPADFDPRDFLADAWGIWYTEAAPVNVTLKFSPGVARRVRETQWHPSEQETEQPDGSLLWRAQIAEPKEMIPWIRGWGADVEVLAPEGLRKSLEKEARKMARVYGVDMKPQDELIAHWRKSDEQAQLLVTHLREASQHAESFAAKVGLPEIGKILGLLHDFGKASKKYQDYLRTQEGLINPDEDGYSDAKRGEIDHSTAGAQLVYQKLASRGREGRVLAQFLALALASHHSGLIDCLKPDGANEFQRRITKDDKKDTHLSEAIQKLPEIEKEFDEILALPIEKRFFEKIIGMIDGEGESQSTLAFKHGLLARFLLSCLLDADRLNTADFEKPGNEDIRNYGEYIPWDVLIERLEQQFANFDHVTAQMDKDTRAYEVNLLRAQVAQVCLDCAPNPKGIYRLTVPTGGGKTLASLRFALHHAKTHKMDRVFYVVPYLTIIDQNAKEVRKALKDTDENGKPLDKVVLEHHSNFVPEKDTRHRHNLLAEDWDAPVIFTTQVQFLEALFGSGTRDARRMHQLANSVIILDEVQTVPIKLIRMFNTAMRFLVHDCGATVLLCTATQPPLEDTGNDYRNLTVPRENHIVQNEPALFRGLKRVDVYDKRKPEGWTNTEIADLAASALREKGSVLIVVNTRASAQALYKEIKERQLDTETYHLSTNMCPTHRLDVLENKIKPKLKANEPVTCVSTQLIEAGVDIDFGAVIRTLAGLDSIAQSAGRCNRHGAREGMGSVWVVNPQEENLDRLPDIQIGRGYADTVLNFYRNNPTDFDEDRIGLKAIKKYYNFYYQRNKDELNYPVRNGDKLDHDDNLFNLLSHNTNAYKGQVDKESLKQSFKTASEIFCVIDSLTTGVIVPYGEGRELITALCGNIDIHQKRDLLKRAQRYSVQLFHHKFKSLKEKGAIQQIKDDEIFYLLPHHYDEVMGWSEEPTGNQELLCF